VFLLVEFNEHPDITSRILDHLKETLTTNLRSPHEGKAIFQEVDLDGSFNDNFMMIKCSKQSILTVLG